MYPHTLVSFATLLTEELVARGEANARFARELQPAPVRRQKPLQWRRFRIHYGVDNAARVVEAH